MRGLTAALGHGINYRSPSFTIDHLVIGGGVVGLAVAQRLAVKYPDKSTYLIERHTRAGEETSSRNSEVIHAGLYYPPKSLKSRLCIHGRDLLYSYCTSRSVPFKKVGKLVVALPHQKDYLERLHTQCQRLQLPPFTPSSVIDSVSSAVPTDLISGEQARAMEPDLSSDIALALWSKETGIVDSHALMDSLEGDIEGSDGGELVYGTKVTKVDPAPSRDGLSSDGWVVQMVTGAPDAKPDAVLAKTLINASGLSSHQILNSLLPRQIPPKDKIPIYYARGSYATYRGPGVNRVQRLIYPVPADGKQHAFQSLGTHLTLDMDGNVRFGPDVEWIEPPANQSTDGPDSERPEDIDFWVKHLSASSERIPDMHTSIQTFLPGVKLIGLSPDYVGIRPKLKGPGGGFEDFVLRVDRTGSWSNEKTNTGAPMITLMGIESPGLTSSLAIAEMVVDGILVHRK